MKTKIINLLRKTKKYFENEYEKATREFNVEEENFIRYLIKFYKPPFIIIITSITLALLIIITFPLILICDTIEIIKGEEKNGREKKE